MKTKILLLALVLFNVVATSYAHAQDEEMIFPDSDESTIIPAGGTSSVPPTIIDESDAGDVSDVEEYDG